MVDILLYLIISILILIFSYILVRVLTKGVFESYYEVRAKFNLKKENNKFKRGKNG